MEIFRRRLGRDSAILGELGTNPLPSSFEAELKPEGLNLEAVEELARKAESLSGVESVSYGRRWISPLARLLVIARAVGMVLALFVLGGAAFVIAATIRLSVLARRDEIEIQKLVGATDGFVQIPFLIEGFFLASGGSALALAAVWLGHLALESWISPLLVNVLGGEPWHFLPAALAAAAFAIGPLLGLGASFLAVRRYLRV